MRTNSQLLFFMLLFCLVWLPGSSYAGELNQYDHVAPQSRLTLNKYRAMRYVFPDKLLEDTQSNIAFGGGNGINIGNIGVGGQSLRQMEIVIDGDVINYCVNCQSKPDYISDR